MNLHGYTMADVTTEMSNDTDDVCTWQDICEMIDYVSLYIHATTTVMFLGFSGFLKRTIEKDKSCC